VKKVRFFLHLFYAPNNIIEVTEPPFQISRVGWFEFPIRVQVFFHDARNKPVNIIHRLKLATNVGTSLLGNEAEHEIELDKRYLMFAPAHITTTSVAQEESDEEAEGEGEESEGEDEDEEDEDMPLKPIETHEDLMEVIQEATTIFPIISPDPDDDEIYSVRTRRKFSIVFDFD